MYSDHVPSQNINFGYGPANEVKRRLLTLWNSVGFFVTYANIERWRPEWGAEPASAQPLDRWLVARTRQLHAEVEDAYDAYWSPRATSAFEAFVDDLSNWYIRRSRRRFWDGDADALATLWWALTRALPTIAPVMPFLTDHLWRNLVGGPCPDAPPSVHLAPWPEREPWDEELVAEIADVRRVTAAGHRARQASGLKVRQPLRRLVVEGAPRADRPDRRHAPHRTVGSPPPRGLDQARDAGRRDPRRRRHRADDREGRALKRLGGPDGNERLTAAVAVVLVVLLAVEGATSLRIGQLLRVHMFVGTLLVPVVVLKLASTGWRFLRYYAGSAAYVLKGPPHPLLRLLAPLLVAMTTVPVGPGIALPVP